MSPERPGLEELDRAECIRRLEEAEIGRVALSIQALPVVLPVHFGLLDGDVVIRTQPGSKMDAALARSIVAFEVDDYDPESGRGWSVMVRGVAREVTDPAERQRARTLGLPQWGSDGDDAFCRIATDLVTGRALVRS